MKMLRLRKVVGAPYPKRRSFFLLACAFSLQSCRDPSEDLQDESAIAADGGPADRRASVLMGHAGDSHRLPVERAYQPLPARLLMNAPYQAWSDDGSLIHVVAFTPELVPCTRADFYFGDRHIGSADSNGDFVFRRPASRSDNYEQDVIRVACQDQLERWFRGELAFHSHHRDSSFERPVVYVHADRGVYRPGQTIRVRVLAWKLRGEYRPEASRTLTIFLQNSDGQEVGGARVETDQDGIATLEIPLPTNMRAGDYKLVAESASVQELSINVRRSSDTPHRAEAPIQVRTFETPIIEVRHTLGEFLTPAMHELEFDVSLRYLDGATFTAGRLEVTLKQGARAVHLPPQPVSGMGPHHVSITQAQLAAFRTGQAVSVEIAALDQSNRRDTVERTLRIANNPFRATLEAERNSYARGENVSIALRVTDLNSVIVREKPVRLMGCEQTLSARTDSTGIAHFHWSMGTSTCAVSAYVEGTDEVVASSTIQYAEPRPMQSRVVEDTIQEGLPVHVTVRFPRDIMPVERVVHGDLTDSSGAIVQSLSIPIEQREGESVGSTELRPPTWGSMLLSLYAVGVPKDYPHRVASMGVLTDGQSLAVGAVSHLTMTLHGLEEQGQPGEAQHLRVQVQRDGRPADATLGISLVDRGVLAMLDPYEHTPFDRFYDPQVKVLASTGAQTLTWPVVQRSWGVDRYDIGWLPSFGMHNGSDPESDQEVRWERPLAPRSLDPMPPIPTSPTTTTAIYPANQQLNQNQPSDPSSNSAPVAHAQAPSTLGSSGAPAGGSGHLVQGSSGAIDGIEDTFGFGGLGHGHASSNSNTNANSNSNRANEGLTLARISARARRAPVDYGGRENRAPSIRSQSAMLVPSTRARVVASEVQNTRGRTMVEDEPEEPQGPIVVVRTGGDETALWLPRARAEHGEFVMDRSTGRNRALPCHSSGATAAVRSRRCASCAHSGRCRYGGFDREKYH
jgi:hypothetical protein